MASPVFIGSVLIVTYGIGLIMHFLCLAYCDLDREDHRSFIIDIALSIFWPLYLIVGSLFAISMIVTYVTGKILGYIYKIETW